MCQGKLSAGHFGYACLNFANPDIRFLFRIPRKYYSNLNIMGLLYLQSNNIKLRGRIFYLLSDDLIDDPGTF